MINKPVSISKNAFTFCRVGVAVIIWLGYLLRIKELVYLSFAILFLSALLKIKRAPMILFYTNTIDRLFKNSKQEVVNEQAMRFAHIIGSVFSGVCSLLLRVDWRYAWGVVLIFALIKTVSACGFCPASKLYQCATNGQCCRSKSKC